MEGENHTGTFSLHLEFCLWACSGVSLWALLGRFNVYRQQTSLTRMSIRRNCLGDEYCADCVVYYIRKLHGRLLCARCGAFLRVVHSVVSVLGTRVQSNTSMHH